jgi:predicted alpha/beta-hydrolase family hydrolase
MTTARRKTDRPPAGVTVLEIDTPHGTGRAHVHVAPEPTAALVLGHGAAGGVSAPDLLAVTEVARPAGCSVALVEQPYVVAGRRSPAPASRLDEAWTVVVDELRRGELPGVPLIVGGRSAGARVACRTVAESRPVAVLCLAFPLHPPGRPERSRAAELGSGVPTLVVNGDRDPFGVPEGGPDVRVVTRPGERHDLRGDPPGTAAVVRDWLRDQGWTRA